MRLEIPSRRTIDSGHIDNPAPLPLEHSPDDLESKVIRAEEVHTENSMKFFDRNLEKRTFRPNGRVVDQNVNWPDLPHCIPDHFLDRLWRRDVACHNPRS